MSPAPSVGLIAACYMCCSRSRRRRVRPPFTHHPQPSTPTNPHPPHFLYRQVSRLMFLHGLSTPCLELIPLVLLCPVEQERTPFNLNTLKFIFILRSSLWILRLLRCSWPRELETIFLICTFLGLKNTCNNF